MSEQLRESVSAVMDGEANELELRRVLSADSAEIVRGTWSRYHRVKDIIQGNENELAFKDWDISLKVSEALADEQITIKKGSAQSSWYRPAASFAVAASVAFAVVVGVQGINQGEVTPEPAVAVEQSEVSNPSRVYPLQSTTRSAKGNVLVGANNYAAPADLPGAIAASKAAADIEAQKRLDKYILRHTERAALNNGKGMISFARVAKFETE